ncbi:MAG: hypothetical protein R2849_10735 [Thermomicrobiales bacterium]
MITTWYGWEHPDHEHLGKVVYGLPELHRDEIKEADYIASPAVCRRPASWPFTR